MRTSPPTCCETALRPLADGVSAAVRLTPRARSDRIDGIVGSVLRVTVTAPPLDNRANEALLQLLAREWRLPRSSLTLRRGEKNRDKIVHIAGDPAALMAQLAAVLGSI